MAFFGQSHGGKENKQPSATPRILEAAIPATLDAAVDAEADFGYFFAPDTDDSHYLPAGAQTVEELKQLGNHMVDAAQANAINATPDSTIPPIFTYWGQFLDHELTARTDREGALTTISPADPAVDPQQIEQEFKNARTPRFDLDNVYGGVPLGRDLPPEVAQLIAGLRHPTFNNKMRVGTTVSPGPLPDQLDAYRDLPRYGQIQPHLRAAAKKLAREQLGEAGFAEIEPVFDQQAYIGDRRNDENLIVAQFHLSILRFHNRVVDYLESHPTGWVADFQSAQTLTRLHYQALIVDSFLKTICNAEVVDKVVNNRAREFFQFRAGYDQRNPNRRLGNALPLEFSVAAYRFGHSMVRNFYDFNKNFGRPGSGSLNNAPFELLFRFTGGGRKHRNEDPAQPRDPFQGSERLPQQWIIDWRRFTGVDPQPADGDFPARYARKIDTELAPPLADMLNEGIGVEGGAQVQALFKHLAQRNLLRGYNLKLPTGQALHRYLKNAGAVDSAVIEDVSTLFECKPGLYEFLTSSYSQLHHRTPLWFYILAEAEAGGGNSLGEVGSWLVASTFIGVLLSDPDSALSLNFDPAQSPLRMPDGSEIDSIVKFLQFALVME